MADSPEWVGGNVLRSIIIVIIMATIASADTESNMSSTDAATPVAYFGISLEAGTTPCDDEEMPLVFKERSSALLILKKYRGARFKAFGSREEAVAFSLAPAEKAGESTYVPDCTTTALIGQTSCDYKLPVSQDLVKLRKAVENGDTTFFKETVLSNPRYLVGHADTPTILQEGYRYNALHVACAKRQPALVLLLLKTLQDELFLKLIYPDDSLDVMNQRKTFLVDLYLNMPEKGRCETPLHLACKFGCYEAAEILVAFPECDKNRRNKEGKTPRDIICDRVPAATADFKKRMESLFEERLFVPVLRSDDNTVAPTVGEPFSPSASPKQSPTASPRDTSLSIMAAAGPMSPTEARNIYRQWKTPRQRLIGFKEPLSPIERVRLADIEKGLERIGRGLAKEMKVAWNEYWPFLGCWCNLASPEGLEKLEAHLRCKRSQVVSERTLENFPDASDQLLMSSLISQLCEAFGDLELGPEYKTCESMQDHLEHLRGSKMFRTLEEKEATEAEPGCTILQGGASYKGVHPTARRLENVLFDWAVAHNTGPVSEAELAWQLSEQVLPELAHLERTGGPELWRLHTWLCREVHLLLHDNLTPSERLSLCRALHTRSPPLFLNQGVPTSPSSSDDENDCVSVSDDGCQRYRQRSSRRSMGTLKRHLQCVLHSLRACLESDTADAEPLPCLCFQKTMGSPKKFFPVNCEAQPEEEQEEEDELFFTPPASVCTSSGSSTPAHTPEEGPLFFIEGSCPSKMDLHVLRALEPSLLEPNTLDPLAYPCVHQWMQIVCSIPVETTSTWPSPMVTNLRRSLHTLSLDSPSCSRDGKSGGCHTPKRNILGTQLRPKVLWNGSQGQP
ncbi:hypothetical protein HPB51_015713 [Rhipicephalus microplus]|uniref:ANKLE2 third alpha/beta domain-containing protein n=1 Tax=Rhipicephalus microplus TaxID=6941 RepID=A0A9J6EHK8_RHIMP|nr:hypothetical protein HPB51_015713 [Rhipicephalus microplus]